MLTRLQVKNFRSLESIDLPLGQLVALVGPNGAGKTSVLRAIELVAGSAWPTLHSFRIPQDFTDFDSARDVEIRLAFDPGYVHTDSVSAEKVVTEFRLTCKPYRRKGDWGDVGDLHVDFEPLDKNGAVPTVAIGRLMKGSKPTFGPLRIGTDMRDAARVLFIDHRRSLAQHHPWQRGSILGRLLQPARKEFTDQENFKKAYEQAMDLLRTNRVKSIEETVAATTKRMLGFLGGDRSKSIGIGFGFSDPANPFSSLRLQYSESGMTVPGDELGLGIQSAMVVGVFEAFRQLGGSFGTLVIEEPEMYLHPQAQRYFYRLLLELTASKQCQVIYSTHSPIFAEVDRFEALRLVRREPPSRTQIAHVSDADRATLMKAREGLKIGGKFDSSRNEVLFARKALLVEGYGDRLAASFAADKMGLDVDGEGLAIVDCAGKSGIELVVRVCRALSIPYVVLHDEDVWPINDAWDDARKQKQAAENGLERQNNARLHDAVGDKKCLYVMVPTLEDALGVGRNANDKPRRIMEALHTLDFSKPPAVLNPLIEAVKGLASGIASKALVDYKTFAKNDIDDELRAVVAQLLAKQQKVRGNLNEKADRCMLICIARVDGQPIAMGAIKQATSKDFDADSAGLEKLRSAFQWELGYFYTNPAHVRTGIASHIVSLLLQRYGPHNLMASTEVSPPSAMAGILERNGFSCKGNRWPSAIHGNELGLYLRFE